MTGGLLLLIALDLVLEWLWHSRRKMMGQEYAVALATFVAIAVTDNIELGMMIGVLLAVLAFALSYAEAPLSLHPRVKHSTVVRTFEERSILASNQDKVRVRFSELSEAAKHSHARSLDFFPSPQTSHFRWSSSRCTATSSSAPRSACLRR